MSSSSDSPTTPPGSHPDDAPKKSFGNMSEHHWSRSREGLNEEALDYYRQRSKDPGVAEGGTERNFYCMDCGGVIPHASPGEKSKEKCPHCGAALSEDARRYFNWVEIDRPVQSDLPVAIPILIVVGLLGVGLIVLGIWAVF